jgi:hypothetical protein
MRIKSNLMMDAKGSMKGNKIFLLKSSQISQIKSPTISHCAAIFFSRAAHSFMSDLISF